MSEHAEHAVTVLVSRQVKERCDEQFERVTTQLLEVAARAPGYLGSQMIRPGEEPGVQDGLYHIVLAFDNQEHLDAWQGSAERALGLAATMPYIEGPPTLRSLSGLALWYRSARVAAPPRWKVAVVTWLGICPTVYLLFLLTWDTIGNWPLLPRVAALTAAVVLLMTFLIAPALTRIFRPWLNAPRG